MNQFLPKLLIRKAVKTLNHVVGDPSMGCHTLRSTGELLHPVYSCTVISIEASWFEHVDPFKCHSNSLYPDAVRQLT
jgi:hypothetical protein